MNNVLCGGIRQATAMTFRLLNDVTFIHTLTTLHYFYKTSEKFNNKSHVVSLDGFVEEPLKASRNNTF